MPKKKVKKQKSSPKSSNSVSDFIKKFFLLLLVGVVVGTGTLWFKNSSGVLGANTSECQRKSPTLSTKPASYSAPSGSKATYLVSVKNNDSVSCASRTITLSRTLPSSSWRGGFGAGNNFSSTIAFTIKPGETKFALFSLVSPSRASQTAYNANISVTALNIKKSVRYIVDNTSVTPGPMRMPTPTPTKRPTPTPAR